MKSTWSGFRHNMLTASPPECARWSENNGMPTTARYRLYALLTLCAAPYAAMLIFWARHGHMLRSALAFLAAAALGSLLLAYCTRSWRRFFLAYFPLLLVSAAYAAYALSYGIVPGHTLAVLLLSASLEEIRGVLLLWPQKWLLLPLLAVLTGYLWLAWRLPAWPILTGKSNLVARVLLALTVPAVAYAATNSRQLVDGLALNPAVGSVMFLAGELPRERAEIRGVNVVKAPFHATRDDPAEEVHILIIGESGRRDSWSVYGYLRQTTPYLEHIKNETILLQHVTADANLTAMAVPMILTGLAATDLEFNGRWTPGPDGHTVQAPPANGEGVALNVRGFRGTLLDVAKEGGYTTTWLVNQDIGVTTSLGISADHFDFPPEMQGTVFGRAVLDDKLLAPYRRELNRSGVPRFIGMHVMGSHWEYYRRYPPTFQRFGRAHDLDILSIARSGERTDQALVDAYDNSVLYTDWFIEQVIEATRPLKVPVTVTFLPDHGESLAAKDEGMAGHGGPIYSASQFKVPAFVWLNDAYRKAHPQKVAALEANADRPIRSHEFFYTVADLMGLSWPDEPAQHSFASTSFVPDTSGEMLVGGVPQTHP
jgi:glucan phosphoethanolaminetransferase (alkaline phosphatase superfamily)